MRVSHNLSAEFDDDNLIATGGLVPVMLLAESAGLWDLVDEYVTVAGSAGANAEVKVGALVADDEAETQGVNDRRQLAEAEAELRRRTNLALLAAGVTMVDPTTTYVDTTVEVAPDVTLFPNTLLQGSTVVGERSEIGPNTRIVDSVVGTGCRVESSTVRDAEVGDDSVVGPYAYIEPGSDLAAGSRTGAFYTGPSGGGS